MLFEHWYELKSDRSRESRESFNKYEQTYSRHNSLKPGHKIEDFSFIKLTLVETRLKFVVWSFKMKNRGCHHNFIQLHTHITSCYFNDDLITYFITTFIGLREMSQFEKLSGKIARCWNFQFEMQIQTEINLTWWRYWTSLNRFEAVSTNILFAHITVL